MKNIIAWCLTSLWFMSCAAFAATSCVKVSEVCGDANSIHTVNGIATQRDCWRYDAVYQCQSAETQDTCGPLLAEGCSQVNSVCLTTNPDGTCEVYKQDYQCIDQPGTTVNTTVCQDSFCTDPTTCFDTSAPPDPDFGTAVANAEAMREIGIYGVDAGSISIFNGFESECSNKTGFGGEVKSCCTAKGGGEKYSNHYVRNFVMDAATSVVKEEVKAGAKWAYDELSNLAADVMNGFAAEGVEIGSQAGATLAAGITDTAASGAISQSAATGGTDAAVATADAGSQAAVAGGTAVAATGTEFGAYGFTFSYSAETGFSFVGFNPWTFIIMIIIMVVMDWLACDAEDVITAMRKGVHLCDYFDSYCSNEGLGSTCLEVKEQYCCFNSVLAKLINRQGRDQLGLTKRECGGFSIEQVEQLDFSKMDFSEFIQTLTVPTIDKTALDASNAASAQKLLKGYYEK
jgi:conjugal transfer mating pair stabilization protein TraN